jgi:5-methylcytosine-specific restriction enzyme subunit McrC
MKTDIILNHTQSGRRIVIDTKFTSIVKPGQYREETLNSGYLYQIHTYLRSQERDSDPLSKTAEGLLLHPTIGKQVNESLVTHGHEIRFATVDLAANAKEIRSQLLKVIGVSEESTG